MECVASGGFTGKIMEGCALRTQTSEKHSSVFTDEKHGKHPPIPACQSRFYTTMLFSSA